MPPKPPALTITAAASRIRIGEKRKPSRTQDWQTEAWTMFDEVGEAKYAIYFIANHLAKMRLYPALVPDDPRDTPTPDTSDLGRAALDAFRGPNGTYSELIKELAVNWQVAGECYLVGTEPANGSISASTAQTWDILSTDEIRISDDGFHIRDAPNTPERPMTESQAYVVRMWLPHPRYGDRPDSLFRGVLASCEEIKRLERAIRSAAKSRAAGPGLLLIPDEVSFGATDPTTETDGDGEAYSDPFTRALIDAMVTPIKDEGSASSVVPLVVRAPADMLDKIRKVDLSIDIDEKLMTLERAVTRLAWGLNVPPEVILGKGDLSHWTAWQVSEEVFSAHVEPLAIPMVIALTNEYYRPYLIASGMASDEADRHILWYDPTPLIVRPNRSSDADFGLEHIALSDSAWRRAKGFAEDDAPGVDEAIKRLILQRGSFDPVFTSILMKMLGLVDESTIDVINQPPVPSPTPALPAPEVGIPDEERPTRGGPPRRGGSLVVVASAAPADDGRRLLDADIDFETRIHAAADAAYTRATERATSQIISRFRSDERFSLRTIPKSAVAATVGRAAIAEVGLNLSDTLREAFTPLHDRFVAAAERLYARAARVTGIPITPDLTRITEAAASLTNTLTALAAERLFDPDPNTDLFGELDDTTVPYAYIRDAATKAGGGATTDQPGGGIACGTLVLSTLHRAGVTIDGWEWVYTERSRTRAYSPHADLDGVRFTTFTDAALANRSTWPPVTHYYPGDHPTCVCKMAPVLSVTPAAEEAV